MRWLDVTYCLCLPSGRDDRSVSPHQTKGKLGRGTLVTLVAEVLARNDLLEVGPLAFNRRAVSQPYQYCPYFQNMAYPFANSDSILLVGIYCLVSSSWRQEAGLVCRTSFRTAVATQRNAISKNKIKKQNEYIKVLWVTRVFFYVFVFWNVFTLLCFCVCVFQCFNFVTK